MKIKLISFILISLFISLSLPAGGEDSRLTAKASANKAVVSAGEELQLTISVISRREAAAPVINELDGFDVAYAGSSNPESEITAGGVFWKRIFLFRLISKEAGVFEIPPVKVNVDGKIVETNPVSVRVTENKSAAVKEDAPIFVKADVSPREAYVGQQIIYTIKFYRSIPVSDPRLEDQVFEGFLSEDIGTDREYPVRIGRKEYYVYEKNIVLFPARPGEFIIQPAGITCEFSLGGDDSINYINPFAGKQLVTRTFYSNTADIRVILIPEQSMPENFSNAVGKYIVKSEISRDEVKAGETTVLILTVRGKGNIRDITLPDFPELEGAKVYDDQSVVNLFNSSGSYSGEKIFKKTIVPLKAGKTVIEPVRISFFDPDSGKYDYAETEKIFFNVLPNPDINFLKEDLSSEQTAERGAVKQLSSDIFPIKTSLGPSEDLEELYGRNTLLFVLLAPPLVYVFLFVWNRRVARYREDPRFARSVTASKKAASIFKSADSELLAGNTKEACGTVLKAVKSYFGDKIGLDEDSFDSRELCNSILDTDIREEKKNGIIKIINDLETLCFSSAGISQDEATRFIRLAREAVKDSEKYL